MDFPVIDPVATGERIKELREQKHLKVGDLRQLLRLESEQSIYKWQRGESIPTVDNLYALSKFFGTTIDDIIRGSREEESECSLSPFLNIIKQRVILM